MDIQIPFSRLSRLDRAGAYASALAFEDYFSDEPLNCEAVFSDETDVYQCQTGDSTLISLRVFSDNVADAAVHLDGAVYSLAKERTAGLFDFFSASVPSKPSSYYFSIKKNSREYFYNKRGLFYDVDPAYNFRLIPDFDTPDWAASAIMYQIFVDRFYNGDKTNDVVSNEYIYLGRPAKRAAGWDAELSPDDVCTFYGGDLRGVMDKLPYLKDLGVDVIYFNPIFVSPSSHKYDTQDYDYIDPHFGVITNDGGETLSFDKFHNRHATMYKTRTTDKANLDAGNRLFCELVEAAHRHGIKVILDGVFNHCGAFHKWMDKENLYSGKDYPDGAYRSEQSPYHNYFKWFDRNWPNNDCYVSWWNFDNHPKLNFDDSPELYAEVLRIAKKWVSPPYNADGWRLDVAADLGLNAATNHKFWRDFRAAVKEANPSALILAEHYGDPSGWLDGEKWDSIMNYDAFMEPITWFLTGMEKHSEAYKPELLNNAMAFEGAIRYHMARMPVKSLYCAMNELSNHDHSRFMTRTNSTPGRLHTNGSAAASAGIKKAVFMEAVTFQMTWPGAPTVYYGDEAGLCGWTDPDDRRPYPWDNPDRILLDFHKKIIAIHKRYAALKYGSVEFLYNDSGILSYGRFLDDDKNAERIAVAINNNDSTKCLRLPLWKIGVEPDGIMELLLYTEQGDFSIETIRYPVSNGFMALTLPARSSVIMAETIRQPACR